MASIMGGPNIYIGKTPKAAHMHMFIPKDLILIRSGLLKESLKECHIPPDQGILWLKKDALFFNAIINKSSDECVRRFPNEPILNFPNPFRQIK